MPYHKPARLSMAVSAVLLAVTLSACQGDDDGAGTTGQPAPSSKDASPAATASQAEAGSGGDVATGESVTGKVAEEEGPVTYEITAEKVDLGTEAEAAALVQDKADAKGKVLAIAHVKFTHTSGPAISSSSDVNDGTTIWADGQRGAILIGAPDDAAGCEDVYDIDSWKAGESHTVCTSYLVPAAAKNVEVHWSEEDGEPYIWTFPNG
ncbi:hypothetical protein [Streptomyces sp. NPDC056987]|uniref:hypothetical protein n=1 Tax=Streptomyces sp. NPDC056987 TaxID=3345988 RepID=UPI00363C4A42